MLQNATPQAQSDVTGLIASCHASLGCIHVHSRLVHEHWYRAKDEQQLKARDLLSIISPPTLSWLQQQHLLGLLTIVLSSQSTTHLAPSDCCLSPAPSCCNFECKSCLINTWVYIYCRLHRSKQALQPRLRYLGTAPTLLLRAELQMQVLGTYVLILCL